MVITEPNYKNKEWLKNQYITLKKSTVQIAKELNVDSTTINNWLKKFSIKIRTSSEARKGKNIGEKNPKWKGDLAKEKSKCKRIHNRVRRFKPKPECCEVCGKKTSRLELSFNLFHKYDNPIYYTENPDDYTYRCNSCHQKYDKRIAPKQPITLKNFLFS